MRAGDGERGGGVIERGRFPGIRGVAGAAIGAQTAVMLIIFLVAGIAVGGRALENIVGMTAQTIGRDVLAGQFEDG